MESADMLERQDRYERLKLAWGLTDEQLQRFREIRGDTPPADPFTPNRIQGDGMGDVISDLTAITPEGESMTRQELAADTDINVMLGKFGVMQQQRPDPIFTETDYSLDLQAAYAAVAQSKRAVEGIPEELREKYTSSYQLLSAVESGEYEKDLRDLQARKDAEAVKKEEEKRAAAAPAAPPEVTPKA